MTPDAFRQRFPIFERKVFLNSCSKGALSQEVEKGYRDYLDSWRHEGSPWGDWVDKLEEVRGAFAAFIGAAADELAVSYSASTATASLLSALSFDAQPYRHRRLRVSHDRPKRNRSGAAWRRDRSRARHGPSSPC